MTKISLFFVSAFLLWKGTNYLLTPVEDNPIQHRFVEAAAAGDIPGMEKAFAEGATVDGYTSSENGSYFGGPALDDAISNHELEAVRWLLDHEANPNHVPADLSPLESAEYESDKAPASEAARKIVELLKKHGGRHLREF